MPTTLDSPTLSTETGGSILLTLPTIIGSEYIIFKLQFYTIQISIKKTFLGKIGAEIN